MERLMETGNYLEAIKGKIGRFRRERKKAKEVAAGNDNYGAEGTT